MVDFDVARGRRGACLRGARWLVISAFFVESCSYEMKAAPPPSPRCGDGVVAENAEICDDGNQSDGDGCDAQCATESGWACTGSTPSVCAPICGDGLVRGPEACDDGNSAGNDGCSGGCVVRAGYACAGEPSACAPVCGDGLRVGVETCDDGNHTEGDGCSPSCEEEIGWACDRAGQGCFSICGDGLLVGSETCDDGNTRAGDGCSPSCVDVAYWQPLLSSVIPYVSDRTLAASDGREAFFLSIDGLRIYDPISMTWRRGAQSSVGPLIQTRLVAFEGDLFLIDAGTQKAERYSPESDTWRLLAGLPQPDAMLAAPYVVVAGHELVLMSGSGISGWQGAVYDTVVDAWIPMNFDGCPEPSLTYSVLGNAMGALVLSVSDESKPVFLRYDRSTARWSSIPAQGAPTLVGSPTAFAMDENILVIDFDASGVHGAFVLDLASGLWRSAELPDELMASWDSLDLTPVWGGSELLLFSAHGPPWGYRFVPAIDHWDTIPSDGEPAPRDSAAVVNIGDDVMIFGGFEGERFYVRIDGALFSATSSQWRPVLTREDEPAPLPTWDFSAAIAQGRLVTFGGFPRVDRPEYRVAPEPINDAWTYTATASKWTRLPGEGAPSPRAQALLAWTGERLIVWGGIAMSDPSDGGALYDFEQRRWTPMSTGDRDASRDVLGVWAGSSFIVYSPPGGNDPEMAAYSPVTDSWRRLLSPPAALSFDAKAVWTGEEILFVSREGLLRFNPVSEVWSEASLEGSPLPIWPDVRCFAATWAQDALFVTSPEFVGRYVPMTDTWTRMDVPETTASLVYASCVAFYTGTNLIFLNEELDGMQGASVDLTALRWSRLRSAQRYFSWYEAHWSGQALMLWDGTGDGLIMPY